MHFGSIFLLQRWDWCRARRRAKRIWGMGPEPANSMKPQTCLILVLPELIHSLLLGHFGWVIIGGVCVTDCHIWFISFYTGNQNPLGYGFRACPRSSFTYAKPTHHQVPVSWWADCSCYNLQQILHILFQMLCFDEAMGSSGEGLWWSEKLIKSMEQYLCGTPYLDDPVYWDSS